MNVIYAEGVFEELVNLSFYIAKDNKDVAQLFLNACDEAFRFLAVNPGIGSIRNFKNAHLLQVRMWRIKDFEKYLIFYQPLEKGIKVLHIFHSARDYKGIFENN